MELQSALENRKSIRSYLSKDVEPEKLTALMLNCNPRFHTRYLG